MSQPSKPRVVIVGGGFGGLYAAQALRNSPAAVTLIDRRNFHPVSYTHLTLPTNREV